MTQPRVSVEIDGVKAVVRQIRKIEDGAADMKSVHKKAASAVEVAVKAPVVSGRLAGDIRSTGTAGAGVIRAGRKSVPYAGPIHWGWAKRGIKANPFLVTAAELKTPKVVDIYEDGMTALIKKHNLNP